MPELAGKENEIYLLVGTTPMTNATGAPVLGVDKSTFGQTCELLEITQFGDDYKKRLAGLKDCSFSLSGSYYPDDATGQNELVPGDAIYIGVYPQGPSVAGKQMPVLVESFEITADVGGKQEFSASLSGNGAPVELPIRP